MSHQDVLLDVREEIRAGGAPCSRIMDSAARLKEGDTLRLIAPFEPTPLYEVLGRLGFVHQSSNLGGGDWEVRFTRNVNGVVSREPDSPVHRNDGGCRCSSGRVVEVDARGLEPPQPMVRILETLSTLPDDAALCAFTDRQPVHLFDQLEARGFIGVSEENSEGGYITHIRRR